MAAVVELGKLTEIVYLDGAREISRRWSLRSAPLLAVRGKRLVIAYPDGRARGASREDVARFRRLHWGEEGRGEVRDARIALGPFVRLGAAVRITYTTRKGGDGAELVDYVHEFGEGGRGRFVPPIVLEHDHGGRACASRGLLALSGGTYHVSERGIVG